MLSKRGRESVDMALVAGVLMDRDPTQGVNPWQGSLQGDGPPA